jgi:Zn-dependent protease with chaperone function
MDTKFSVIYSGEIVDSMLITEVEKNLQQQYKLSEQKSKQFLSKQRTVKKGLTKNQALRLQQTLLSTGMKTQLLNDQSQVLHPEKNTLCRADIDEIFNGKMAPIKASRSYDIGLFLTLFLTLSIPVLYLTITGLAIYSTAVFMANISSWFDFQHFALIKGLIVFSILFMGTLLSFFLLRPLIPQSHHHDDEILDPDAHPDLFYLIQALSRYMSVPMPSEIRMNHEVNASASLKDGIRGLKQGELVLTLGYPLISGMNTRQLVGIIAHEFGHFSQRNGMAVHYLINSINFWLQERAYADYGLALLLKRWRIKYDEGYFAMPIVTASAGIWLSQQCLKKLFHMSLYCSQYMSREMEFNADHHECKIVGSDYFSNTAIRLHQLSFAEDKVAAINEHFWNENVLLKNIPQAINTVTNNLSKHEKKTVQESIHLQQGHPWDSHPPDYRRIEHALALNELGIFHLEFDASRLFNNYEQVCLEQTLAIYNGNRRHKFDDKLIDNDRLFALHKEDEQSDKLVRISQFGIDLQGRIANIPVKLTKALSNASLKEIDVLYLDIDQRVKHDIAYYSALRSKRLSHTQAHAYAQAGLAIEHDDFQLSETEANRIALTLNTTETHYQQCETSFNYYDQFITAKILATLKEKSNSASVFEHSHIKALNALKVLKTIKGAEQELDNIRLYSACINGLLNSNKTSKALNETVAQYQKQLVPMVRSVMQKIAATKAVNRFSNEPLTLLDFAHLWHPKPALALEDMGARPLADYAITLCNSLLKQHNLHLRKLLICSQ